MVRALASHARGQRFKSSTAHHAEVAEWQTRYVQGVVSIRAWEFKSPLRHYSYLGACSSVIERSPAEAEVVGSRPAKRAMGG